MQNNQSAEGKSKLALAIESRARKAHVFEVQGFFGLGDKPIHKIAIWVNVKAEQDQAIAAAYEVVNGITNDTTARSDDDLLLDAKTIQILFHACRRCEEEDAPKADGERSYNYPAFPGPDWMRKNLTTDQLAVLLNLYHEVRRRESPVKWEIDSDQVMALAEVCATYFESDLPDTMLAARPREWLTQAFMLLARRYKDLADGQQEDPDVRGEDELGGDADGAPEAPGDPG